MVAIREKTLINIQASAVCPTHTRTDAIIGRHAVAIDEPERNGGTDSAATPLGTLVASLLGCSNVILNRIAAREGVAVDGLELRADAVLDRRGAALMQEVAVPFPTIDLHISFASDATPEQVEILKADLGRFCPVAKTLRQAGTVIEEHWRVRPRH